MTVSGDAFQDLCFWTESLLSSPRPLLALLWDTSWFAQIQPGHVALLHVSWYAASQIGTTSQSQCRLCSQLELSKKGMVSKLHMAHH